LRIGVDKTTVFNWESGAASASLRALPGVIEFLGYDPGPSPEATDPGRLVGPLHQRHGLSIGALADRLGVDPSTVRGWDQRGHKPGPQIYARLVEVLDLPAVAAGAAAAFGEPFRGDGLIAGLMQSELADRIGVAQQVMDCKSGRKTPGEKAQAQTSQTV
jgi:DNA-binding transcriptional regulator YiaG